jgi:hypothetical protein
MLFATFYIFEILGLSLTLAQPRPPARLPNVDIDEIENKGKLLKNEKKLKICFSLILFSSK